MRCPAHSDRNPSLSLDANADGDVLVYCQAGCDTDAVLTAVGLTRRDLYPDRGETSTDPVVATYRYTDLDGQLLFEVQRTVAKRFRQRRPDPTAAGKWVWNLQGVRRVLYRLPLVADAIAQGLVVYLVEGEKDVHSLEQLGLVATTNPGGAGKWRPEYTEALRGAHIVAITDRDREGQGLRHMLAVRAAVAPVAASFILTQPRSGKDITDHLTAGHTLDELDLVGADIPAPVSEALGEATRGVDDAAPVSPAPEPERALRLSPASGVVMAPVHWVWRDRIPIGELCLVPGREGIGKSIFLAWLTRVITRGELPGEFAGEPRAVMYAAAEDSWQYTIAPRMHAAGANLDLVYRVDVVDAGVPGRLTLPQHCDLIPAAAEQAKAAILMCDPILSNLDDRLNPNQSRELRQALEPLRRAAEQARIAVVGLAHFNKSTEGDVLSKMAGGRAWAEVARAVIAIARETREDDGVEQHVQVLTQSKNNLGRTDLPSLEYTIESYRFPLDPDQTGQVDEIETARLIWSEGVSDTSVEEILNRRPGQARDNNRRANIERVLDILDDATAAMSPREVADHLAGEGIGHETVKKILQRLSGQGQIDRVGTGLYKRRGQ